jgi:hypothetical protein
MDGHEAVLAWLDPVARNPSPYGFEVTDLAEGTQPGPDLVSGLGEIVVRTKTRPEVLERMARALGWEDALARLRRGRKSIRRGDFGEALACEILEAVDDLSVPIRKLRYQTDPEQTLHGTDVVGFQLRDDGSVEDLHFLECKLRTFRDLTAGVEAHNQLLNDRLAGYADTLMFLADRLHETNPVLLEAFEMYLGERDRAERGSYGVMLVWDSDRWDEDVLARVDEIAERLTPLHVRIALAFELATLIERVYDSIGVQVVDNGT